jgi:hypothetical protein
MYDQYSKHLIKVKTCKEERHFEYITNKCFVSPWGVEQRMMECIVKALYDVKSPV